MANSHSPAMASMTCGLDQPTQDAHCRARKISFVFYCAPRDDGGRNVMYTALYGQNANHTGVTDSGSYLTNLPFVVVDADTHKVIYPYDSTNGKTGKFNPPTLLSALHDGDRKVHALPPIRIPDNVTRVALHIANDAFEQNRKFQLFPWTIPSAEHCKVHIYEVRVDLQEKFSEANQIGSVPTENTISAKPGATDEYFSYLNGDLWLNISHEFTDDEIVRLCPAETLSRMLPVSSANSTRQNETPQTLNVDWVNTLRPIYSSGGNSRSLAAFNVQIPTLGITVKFASRALANAINTSARTTVQQALRRTSPRAFAAILKAAWHLNIDTVHVSSSWRPMLGSSLHKMGIGLDVTEIHDIDENIHFSIRNHSQNERRQTFPSNSGGRKLHQLYEELNVDPKVLRGQVYTPWINWVDPHDNHMHITVKY